MQKIFVNHPGAQDGRPPFWMPWGCGGCLWRTLVFISTLLLMLYMMSRCHGNSEQPNPPGPFVIDTTVVVPNPANDDSTFHINPNIDPLPLDSVLGANDPWLPEHPGGNPITPELPADSANTIAPIDNPVRDSLGVTVNGNALNVLISLQQKQNMEEEMAAWAQKFKQVYPDQDYAVTYYNPLTCLMQITVPENMREQVKSEINSKMPMFDFIVFDEEIMGPSLVPNDPAMQDQSCNWWHQAVQLYEAWDITMGNPDIVIGVVDSYFDLRHPEIRNKRIISPLCLSRMQEDRTNLLPPEGCDLSSAYHGTHVLCCAAAEANNQEGSSGVSPKCSVIPVSVADPRNPGHCSSSLRIAEGFLYCIMHGANVINCSMGANLEQFASMPNEQQVDLAKTQMRAEENVWDYVFRVAERRNCTIVFAAGNESAVAGIDASKRNNNTIRVSACSHRLDSVGFTNFGLLPELGVNYSTVSMPGVDIIGGVPNNKYCMMAGTSQAAPLVAGTVALMKSIDPTLTNREIIDILIETGKPQPEEQHIGPLVQIKDALLRVQNRHPQIAEVLEDPTTLEGLWECRSDLVATSTEEPITLYLELKSGGTGLIFSQTSNGIIHESPVSWRVDTAAKEVKIESTKELECPSDNSGFKKVVLTGAAGSNGRMTLIGHHPDGDSDNTFSCDMAYRSRLNIKCDACGTTKNY